MWKKVHCAVQGRGHRKNQVPCQDKTFCYQENGVLVAALADGAGSAKLSHYGAACITEYIAKDLAKYFDLYYNCDDGRAIKKQLISKIIHKLDDLCSDLQCERRDCASTLLVVAVTDDRFILMHIGDGVIGYIKQSKLKVASLPENGEFSNVTVFTTSLEALSTMKLLKGNLGEIDSFVMMSDGTQAGLYSKREKRLSSALLKVADYVRYFPEVTVQDMLKQSLENVVKQVTTDDCSIVVLAKNYNKDIRSLPIGEQSRLLDIGSIKGADRKRLVRLRSILAMLENPISLDDISKEFHLKNKYAKKYVEFFLNKGLIQEKNNKYVFLGESAN